MEDLIIIGGGPAGYLGALRAAQRGLKVTLFEEKSLGGVCLNEGCIPTKSLLYSAKMFKNAQGSQDYGVLAKEVSFDHSLALKRKDAAVRSLVSGVAAQLKSAQVNVEKAGAEIRGSTSKGFLVSAQGKEYEGRNLLIATGARASLPGITGLQEGLAQGFVVTSRELLAAETLPEKLVVIGAGIVGLEMAAYFSQVGCRVTVIEVLDKIAGNTDSEIAGFLQKELAKEGIEFFLNCHVTKISEGKVYYEKEGKTAEIEASKVLISAGRSPNTEGLGLERLGIEREGLAIVTDLHLETNRKGVYAAGDVNAKAMLAHIAYREAEVAVNHMTGVADSMSYELIPSVVYTTPEVAFVGETEETAKAKGLNYAAAKLPMAYSGRFVAEKGKASNCYCKILVDKERELLLGVHLIGSYASEIIWGAANLLASKKTIEELKTLVFPHPTVSEIIREVLFQF